MLDSLLNSITIFDWDGPSFGVGKRGRKVLKKGDPATATIIGIKVTRTSTGDDGGTNSRHYAYALDVAQGAGAPVRMGCRMFVTPRRKLTHLGSQVAVRHRKGRVIIDWSATLKALGDPDASRGDSPEWWKPLKEAPAAGVVDVEQAGNQKRIAGGRAARATVLNVNALGGVFGTIENVDVDVSLAFDDDGSAGKGILKKVIPPDYAAYLLTPGTVLPVGVDRGGERITVDWVAAANRAALR